MSRQRVSSDAWNTAGTVVTGSACLLLVVSLVATVGSFFWHHWGFAVICWILFGVSIAATVVCATGSTIAENRERREEQRNWVRK